MGCGAPLEEPVAGPDARAGSTVRFVALGDQGVGNASQRLVSGVLDRVCEERGCDLAVFLGDNLYPRGMSSPDDPEMDRVFTAIYGSLDLPMYAVLGNHDYAHGRDEQRAKWQVAWARRSNDLTMPGRTYSFQAGFADFFALDTTWMFWNGPEPQQTWLSEALDASTARWRVVFGHHPIRSNGTHGNAGAYEGLVGVPYASGMGLSRFFDAAVCGRADLYLSGHDHNRQWLSHCGVELIVSGAGSKAQPLVDRGNRPTFASEAIGLVWVELAEERLTVAFYDQEGRLEFEGYRARPVVEASGDL